ncbi:MAG: methylenetetrahydrofolate--tRNA-(uracil(54)-C(5))-methyltransferase (FADH(2)-oxidizing) TrmFO [Nitrospirae bacterium CG_4_9_14_3_um_filter_53_35]|nr:MAG: methylenetetrahydrofolate--tRNA-(uracil(54)-C(5))-methyltransferase (FADH(2)-oxidizing) TrmFO [Nitrospirae bacterium CG2_30_53_67]PIS37713.1 MAG: methylenetetrahydrofolate--tRNA-(uracil(54)-C(5))-methyltransferase (FADH(2)-oxidizing) TrmFO [Nitrospirae bacterium CG08_land_8_20_14_0_20_52_24]PIV84280.1 MAG: methylenetetrahydrofolate--tRNA-(uracil(54)-C(5))-methyltransferase (FADH(2)-oxidizing) TrmFO [Nitrospirae bacterium CG17_big_fil_post_rev_8_21_14_2_50_50_9]PIW84874.1 MAG: methylenete
MNNANQELTVIGGGLAGSEAAFQAAERGIHVLLYEMRPTRYTPAHKTDRLAELVCSNSFRSEDPANAVGLLKEEMRRAGSLIIRAADAHRVPAGSALAVDRERFSEEITQVMMHHPRIRVMRSEITEIPERGVVILATGPLTSDRMADSITRFTGSSHLHFYDAIAPILDAESIDRSLVFAASRYDKGGADYLNCPMEREEYDRFYEALTAGEKVPAEPFEEPRYFEGCMPIEVMAERGRETLLFGPMKPVGLIDPRTDRQPYAVVQLRKENREGAAYNMVGFQTKLTYPSQDRVFRLIPGLEKVEFMRYGSVHRNTFVDGPRILKKTLQFRQREDLFLAGQITGVEGYVESTAMGWLAGVLAARMIQGEPLSPPPPATAHGALVEHVTNEAYKEFQPSNVNWSLFPSLPEKIRSRRERREKMYGRALAQWEEYRKQVTL